jgi:glycosidase
VPVNTGYHSASRVPAVPLRDVTVLLILCDTVPQMAGQLFISYRREDTQWHARIIHQRLVATFGRKRVFMDVSSIEGGTDYLRTIRETIALCDVCVALIGDKWWPAADASGSRRLLDPTDLLRIEIASALRENLTVMPCMFEDTKLPAESELPEDLRPLVTRQQVHIAYSSLDRDVEALITAVQEAFARAKRERQRARLEQLRRRFISPVAAFGRRKPVMVAAATIIFLAACVGGVYAFGSRPVFASRMLLFFRPNAISKVWLPTRGPSHPSPADWRDEVLYYVLPDRFSDGHEQGKPLPDPINPSSARPPGWDSKALLTSGSTRWQGGTLEGVRSKLGYLKDLGVSAILLAPVLKQRAWSRQQESYLGFSVQDFLDVDPHLGTRRDLVNLVSDAHDHGLRVILTAPVLSETGPNWVYQGNQTGSAPYPFGSWLDRDGNSISKPNQPDDGVWPKEFQDPEAYERRGSGSFNPAQRDDLFGLRRLRFSAVLEDLVASYKYWMALTDCDGLYLEGLWQIGVDDAREFEQRIRDYATVLGKPGFLIAAEASFNADTQVSYLGTSGDPLDAVMDFNATKIGALVKGFTSPSEFFDAFNIQGSSRMAVNRLGGKRTLAMITNLDDRSRISLRAASPHQIVAAVAVQLFTPGIPCLYYGDEQALWLDPNEFQTNMPSMVYVREAMFGPAHPKKLGRDGLRKGESALDPSLPGFGPFGLSGVQAFNEQHPAFVRIAALLGARRKYAALRSGKFEVALVGFGGVFHYSGVGEIVAWSRSVGRRGEGVLCIVNLSGTNPGNFDIAINPNIYPPGSPLTVVANTMHAAQGKAYKGTYPLYSLVEVKSGSGGPYVEIRDLGPSEVLILAGKPVLEDTEFGQFQNFPQNPYSYGSSSYYPPRKAR